LRATQSVSRADSANCPLPKPPSGCRNPFLTRSSRGGGPNATTHIPLWSTCPTLVYLTDKARVICRDRLHWILPSDFCSSRVTEQCSSVARVPSSHSPPRARRDCGITWHYDCLMFRSRSNYCASSVESVAMRSDPIVITGRSIWCP
jgi:hypothetical protein